MQHRHRQKDELISTENSTWSELLCSRQHDNSGNNKLKVTAISSPPAPDLDFLLVPMLTWCKNSLCRRAIATWACQHALSHVHRAFLESNMRDKHDRKHTQDAEGIGHVYIWANLRM